MYALACGGSEIIEGLAEQADILTRSTHILKTMPEIDYKEIKCLRSQYWNAIKHFYRGYPLLRRTRRGNHQTVQVTWKI